MCASLRYDGEGGLFAWALGLGLAQSCAASACVPQRSRKRLQSGVYRLLQMSCRASSELRSGGHSCLPDFVAGLASWRSIWMSEGADLWHWPTMLMHEESAKDPVLRVTV